MAKRAKLEGDGDTSEKSVDAKDLRRVVNSINAYKAEASTAAANAGQATQQAVEAHSLERQALTWSRKLDVTDPQKRGAVLTAMIDYCDKLGFFDQSDMFGGPVEKMAQIVKRRHNAVPPVAAGDADLNDRLVN